MNRKKIFYLLHEFQRFWNRTRIFFLGKSRALCEAGSRFPATRSILKFRIISEAKVKYSVMANLFEFFIESNMA